MSTIEKPATAPSGTDAPRSPSPAAVAPRPGLNADTLALGGFFVAVFAFLAAILAVGLAARAVDEARSAPSGGGGGSTVPTVELMEFMIMPEPIEAPAGSTLEVENTGTVEHDLGVVDGPETPAIAAGGTGELDISALAPGTYTVICTIAGHREAGMEGTLTVT